MVLAQSGEATGKDKRVSKNTLNDLRAAALAGNIAEAAKCGVQVLKEDYLIQQKANTGDNATRARARVHKQLMGGDASAHMAFETQKHAAKRHDACGFVRVRAHTSAARSTRAH